MANKLPPTFLTLDKLFEKWAQAADRANFWRAMLQQVPEDDDTAEIFAKYDLREKIFYAEIERRADLLPFPMLWDKIISCNTFSYHKNNFS